MMKWISFFLWVFGAAILFINYLAFIHAYKLTHFSRRKNNSKKSPYDFSLFEKLSLILFGFTNPRPETEFQPSGAYEQIILNGHKKLECWLFVAENPKGTVILFHGYSGEKSSYLSRSELFNSMGYSTLLVDFFGSGGSEGSHTTVGFNEAVDVKAAYDFVRQNEPNQDIFLFGNSMGAVAILKAIMDYKINPQGLILECPFGSMIKTIGARFKMMKIPTFPLSQLLAFWGGIQNGFWPFKHNPTKYAKHVNIPTLMFYGEADRRVSRGEIDKILKNIKGPKKMVTFPNIGHDDYLLKFKEEWEGESYNFLSSLTTDKKQSI